MAKPGTLTWTTKGKEDFAYAMNQALHEAAGIAIEVAIQRVHSDIAAKAQTIDDRRDETGIHPGIQSFEMRPRVSDLYRDDSQVVNPVVIPGKVSKIGTIADSGEPVKIKYPFKTGRRFVVGGWGPVEVMDQATVVKWEHVDPTDRDNVVGLGDWMVSDPPFIRWRVHEYGNPSAHIVPRYTNPALGRVPRRLRYYNDSDGPSFARAVDRPERPPSNIIRNSLMERAPGEFVKTFLSSFHKLIAPRFPGSTAGSAKAVKSMGEMKSAPLPSPDVS